MKTMDGNDTLYIYLRFPHSVYVNMRLERPDGMAHNTDEEDIVLKWWKNYIHRLQSLKNE